MFNYGGGGGEGGMMTKANKHAFLNSLFHTFKSYLVLSNFTFKATGN